MMAQCTSRNSPFAFPLLVDFTQMTDCQEEQFWPLGAETKVVGSCDRRDTSGDGIWQMKTSCSHNSFHISILNAAKYNEQ